MLMACEYPANREQIGSGQVTDRERKANILRMVNGKRTDGEWMANGRGMESRRRSNRQVMASERTANKCQTGGELNLNITKLYSNGVRI